MHNTTIRVVNVHVFEFVHIEPIVTAFCDRIPKLLAEHSVTSDLVGRVINLGEQAASPFTVAVVGQMRVGKSSLINALLEKDLAKTGVTETTATINRIHYGENASFARVHWKNKPPELIDREDLQNWVGDSSKAANTRYIEFFDDAAFLKIASIIDTPGLRSVIDAHESATTEFLGVKWDQESRRLGGQADAIIYVMMPVARENDDRLLSDFRDQTPFPDTSSFNSLAVLHKWETIEADDQISASRSKAERIGSALSQCISCVIPVSAPLARASQCLDACFFDTVVRLAGSTVDALQVLLLNDQFFADEMPGCPVTTNERKSLLASGLPWPSLKLIVALAIKHNCKDGAGLRAIVRETGQVDFLRSELERRFFSRSRLLKLLSTVSKAWEPCRLATIRLRNRQKEIGELLGSSKNLLTILDDRIRAGDDDLVNVYRYVKTTQESLLHEHASVKFILEQVSAESSNLEAIHRDFSGDMAGLEWLDTNASETLPDVFRLSLKRLFGRDGLAVANRIPVPRDDLESPVDSIDRMTESVIHWRTRTIGEARQTLEHALHRLEQLADHFEAIPAESISHE